MSTRNAGPNQPCPCGSGKKFKRCCLASGSPAPASDRGRPATGMTGGPFRFEPGSYGGHGMFAASISCQKQVRPDEWTYHFVLANSAFVFEDEQEAVDVARGHLEEAFAVKRRTGSDAAFAAHLSGLGYLKVEGFSVIGESER